jgi:hypothetical protein
VFILLSVRVDILVFVSCFITSTECFSYKVLVLANGALCILFLFGKLIQVIFLGPLRPNEVSKLQDKLGSFLFFKIMFIGAMLEHSVGKADVWAGAFLCCVFCFNFAMF